MPTMGDQQEPKYEEWIATILACGKFVTKSFIVILLIVAAAMFAWIGIWFIFRLATFVFHRYLENPWEVSMALPIFRPNQMNELDLPVGGQSNRRITHIKKHRMPSGAIVQMIYSSNTELTALGGVDTDVLDDVIPELACSDLPRDIHDIQECAMCKALVCLRHSEICDLCGRTFCLACLSGIAIEGVNAIACKDCEAKLTTPKWLRVIREFLWGK